MERIHHSPRQHWTGKVANKTSSEGLISQTENKRGFASTTSTTEDGGIAPGGAEMLRAWASP